MVRSSFVAFVLLAGCGARTDLGGGNVDAATIDASIHDASVHDTSVHDAKPIEDAEPAVCAVPPEAGGPPFPTACGRSLLAGAITPSSSTCFLDLAVKSGENGALTVFCDGGLATAIFSKGTFEGSYDAVTDVVDVCIGTTFQYSDGCTWQSAQRLTGKLASAKLAFTYTEAPSSGTGCASPCSASGEVDVQ